MISTNRDIEDDVDPVMKLEILDCVISDNHWEDIYQDENPDKFIL
jgi:hypothetical protein